MSWALCILCCNWLVFAIGQLSTSLVLHFSSVRKSLQFDIFEGSEEGAEASLGKFICAFCYQSAFGIFHSLLALKGLQLACGKCQVFFKNGEEGNKQVRGLEEATVWVCAFLWPCGQHCPAVPTKEKTPLQAIVEQAGPRFGQVDVASGSCCAFCKPSVRKFCNSFSHHR